MNLFETGRKRDRLKDDSVFAREISPAIFNLIQGGIVVIGWVVNLVLLFYLQNYMKDAVDCAVDICVDTAFAIIRIPVALIGLYLE